VTPVELNGAGCADAVTAVSAEASKRAARVLGFTDASRFSVAEQVVDFDIMRECPFPSRFIW